MSHDMPRIYPCYMLVRINLWYMLLCVIIFMWRLFLLIYKVTLCTIILTILRELFRTMQLIIIFGNKVKAANYHFTLIKCHYEMAIPLQAITASSTNLVLQIFEMATLTESFLVATHVDVLMWRYL